jgi:DNA polymerase-1
MAKVEADDVIAHLAQVIDKEYNGRSIIVSSDKDFLQLVNDNIIVYRPIEKSFYTDAMIVEKIGLKAENFILYKVLMGDASDKIAGVKGLGPKKLFKLFPELKTQHLTLDDIFDIAGKRLKENVIYSRIVMTEDDLRKNFTIMDLAKPMLDVDDKILLDESIKAGVPDLASKPFMDLYNEDSLGGMIRNTDFWLKDNFGPLQQSVG